MQEYRDTLWHIQIQRMASELDPWQQQFPFHYHWSIGPATFMSDHKQFLLQSGRTKTRFELLKRPLYINVIPDPQKNWSGPTWLCSPKKASQNIICVTQTLINNTKWKRKIGENPSISHSRNRLLIQGILLIINDYRTIFPSFVRGLLKPNLSTLQ